MKVAPLLNAETLAEKAGPVVSVDDDEGFHVLLKMVHRRNAREKTLICLDSGEACLEYFSGVVAGEHEMPAVILMDVNMPGLNGFDTVRRIRELASEIELPTIYMLSASNNQTDMQRASEVGADYIEKPFRMSELPIYQNRSA